MSKIKSTVIVMLSVMIGVGLTSLVLLSDKGQKIIDLTSPWQDHYAKSKAEQGAIYGFPYVFNYFLLNSWSQSKEDNPNGLLHDAINRFSHVRNVMTAEYRDGGSPNNDTLYSAAWVNVVREPIVISVPPMDTEERYWTFEIVSFDSDNYAYIGKLSTGNGGGNYALVPRGWQGDLPNNVQFLAEVPTKWSFILGRTLIDGPDDLATVNRLQDQYLLTALSNWGETVHKRPAHEPLSDQFAQYRKDFDNKEVGFKGILERFIKENPQDYIKIMNHSMAINGIPENEQAVGDLYRELGMGFDVSVTDIDESFIKGRDDGVALGLMATIDSMNDGYSSKTVNGWRLLGGSYGRAGDAGNFLQRSGMQSLGGIVANDPEEAVYIVLNDDSTREGRQYPSGEFNYQMHFDADQLPIVNAFWSLSLYDISYNLVANDLGRYSLGDRSQHMKYDEDGGLTIYISHEAPADASKKDNWLPAPKGEFYLIFRTYLPGEDIINQRWAPAPLSLQ